MNLFGRPKSKKKAAPKQNLGDSIQVMQKTIDDLDKRSAHLEKQADGCLALAKKKMAAKDKRGAAHQLKRKKLFMKQIEDNENKKMNLEVQVMQLQGAATNAQVFNAMQTGSQALTASLQQNNIESVEDTMDDIQESFQMAEEVNDVLTQPMGESLFDDGDLEDELDALGDELEEEEEQAAMKDMAALGLDDVHVPNTKVAANVNAAAVPTHKVKPATQEDKELAELEAMMNM